MSVKAALITKNSFLNANLFLEIFQLKVLPKVNKQVGGDVSDAFFSKQIVFITAAIKNVTVRSVFVLSPHNLA